MTPGNAFRMRAVGLILALTAVVTFSGCSGFTAQSSSTSAPSGGGTGSTGTGSGGTGGTTALQLTPAPAALAFGQTTVGFTASLSETITNTGTQNVTISGVSVAGAGYGATGMSAGTVLTPNQTGSLSVTFNPGATGSTT